MLKLNFKTTEELIFKNEAAQAVLPPYFSSYFESWRLSKRIPALKQLGKSSVLDLLNGLKDDHIESLSLFFGETIEIESLNYKVINNIKIPLSELETCRCLCESKFKYLNIWRDNHFLYVSMWR